MNPPNTGTSTAQPVMLEKLVRLRHGVPRQVLEEHIRNVPAKMKALFRYYNTLSPSRYKSITKDPYTRYNEWVDAENAKRSSAAPEVAAAAAAFNQTAIPSDTPLFLPSPQPKSAKRTMAAMNPEAQDHSKRRRLNRNALFDSSAPGEDVSQNRLATDLESIKAETEDVINEVGERHMAMSEVRRKIIKLDDYFAAVRQQIDEVKDRHENDQARQEAEEDKKIKAAEDEEARALAVLAEKRENTNTVKEQAAAAKVGYRRDKEARDEEMEELWDEFSPRAYEQKANYKKALDKVEVHSIRVYKVMLPRTTRTVEKYLEDPDLINHPELRQEAEEQLQLLRTFNPIPDSELSSMTHFRDIHPMLIRDYIGVHAPADTMLLNSIVGIFTLLNDKRYFENEHYLRLFKENEGIKKRYPNGPFNPFPTDHSCYTAAEWQQMLIDFLCIKEKCD